MVHVRHNPLLGTQCEYRPSIWLKQDSEPSLGRARDIARCCCAGTASVSWYHGAVVATAVLKQIQGLDGSTLPAWRRYIETLTLEKIQLRATNCEWLLHAQWIPFIRFLFSVFINWKVGKRVKLGTQHRTKGSGTCRQGALPTHTPGLTQASLHWISDWSHPQAQSVEQTNAEYINERNGTRTTKVRENGMKSRLTESCHPAGWCFEVKTRLALAIFLFYPLFFSALSVLHGIEKVVPVALPFSNAAWRPCFSKISWSTNFEETTVLYTCWLALPRHLGADQVLVPLFLPTAHLQQGAEAASSCQERVEKHREMVGDARRMRTFVSKVLWAGAGATAPPLAESRRCTTCGFSEFG